MSVSNRASHFGLLLLACVAASPPDDGAAGTGSTVPSSDRRGPTHMGLWARPAGEGLLSGALGRTGVGQSLRDAGIDVRGYVEVGYTYNLDGMQDVPYFGRVFTDERGNHVQFDQLNLTVERVVAQGADRFHVGGRLEMIYGFDTWRFHANGLDFYGDGGGFDGPDPDEPLAQFDLTQAYLDFAVPAGNGLVVRAGKFLSLFGAETIDPTQSPFYSRSYLFGWAIPFTHTGVMANYRFDEAGRWDLWGGVVRGWDQATDDENDAVSFTGRLRHRPNEQWEARLAAVIGPEQPECCGGGDDDYRIAVDLVVAYEATEAITLAAEALYGWDESGDVNGGAADWYGVAAYATYEFGPRVSAGLRAEWFHDGDGTRLGTEEDLDVYEATAGLTLTPFYGDRLWSNLAIRPEVRYDWAEDREFIGGRERSQVTVGVDVLLTY